MSIIRKLFTKIEDIGLFGTIVLISVITKNRFKERLDRFWNKSKYKIQSVILGRSFVHVIGDSHTGSFVGRKRVIVHHIGPATAFNINKKNSTTNSYEKINKILSSINTKRDAVVLVFGEIDARIHIYNQFIKKDKAISIPELIDVTIGKYDQLLEKVKELGVQLYVYGIPPAAKQGNIYNYQNYASDELRVYINRQFNSSIKSFCQQKKYNFIDIYSATVDSDGFIKDQYAKDEVHLNTYAFQFAEPHIRSYIS